LGRIAKPIEIAKVIEFLISDKNTYITGAGVDINGGQFLTG
jgi:NAD(P)-dependent dehydrogenase (short-subunit alcohol dehydrogenase family)